MHVAIGSGREALDGAGLVGLFQAAGQPLHLLCHWVRLQTWLAPSPPPMLRDSRSTRSERLLTWELSLLSMFWALLLTLFAGDSSLDSPWS